MERSKVLYAIQGTGNGHVARARALFPALKEVFDVDFALVGPNSDIQLPVQPVFIGRGITMEYSSAGSIDLIKTWKVNRIRNIRSEIRDIPVSKYDFIINDYESISLRAARKKGVPVLGLSHQAAVLNPKSPNTLAFMPVGRWIMKQYAPTSDSLGFHYTRYANDILPPLIDPSFKEKSWLPGKEIVVYLPAYGVEQLYRVLSTLPYRFRIFHREAGKAKGSSNLNWQSIDALEFQAALLNSKAVLCGAGFELPSEALYLGIPLIAIPISGQYEQWCNAEALKQMGVSVLSKLDAERLTNSISEAVQFRSKPIEIADTKEVVERIQRWWSLQKQG